MIKANYVVGYMMEIGWTCDASFIHPSMHSVSQECVFNIEELILYSSKT